MQPNKEQEALADLMKRFFAHERAVARGDAGANRLLIKSAFSNQMTPGVLYIEAFKQSHVQDVRSLGLVGS